MSSLEEFTKRIADDPEYAKSLYEAHKAGPEPKNFTDAMTEFTAKLIESTKATVREEVDKIVKAGITEAKTEALESVSAAFGLTKDSPVMKSELADLIRKGALELNEPGKKSLEPEVERDDKEPITEKSRVLDPAARFEELKKGQEFHV